MIIHRYIHFSLRVKLPDSIRKYKLYFLALFILLSFDSRAKAVQQDTAAKAADSVILSQKLQRYKLPSAAAEYPVLYDRQQAESLTGAVGYLKGDKLESTSSAFTGIALTGRIAGLYTRQTSGAPGTDDVNYTLRGLSPVVFVDGVQRTINSINPEQIESITVLKDAVSTAMLGVRSMNGAILITTRKGRKKRGFNIDFTAQSGISEAVRLPKPLSALDYSLLYNEALENEGRAPIYSQTDLDAYKTGSDPYGHPDINWYDEILKNSAPFSRYTINSSGSNEKVSYFVSLDYMGQDGLFKGASANTYSTNADYERYIFRSNIGVALTPRLSADFNLFGRVTERNTPGSPTDDVFTAMQNTPANAYPVFNPDTTLGGNINYNNNIYGQSVLSGYRRYINSSGYADLVLKREMDDLLKGLWLKGTLSFNLAIDQHLNRSKDFETFQMQVDPLTSDTLYQRYGTKSDQRNTSTVDDQSHKIYAELAAGYTHKWDSNSLNVLLLYNQDSYRNQSTLPNIYQTLAGKVQYSIHDKYILEGVASYSGNNRYEAGNRFGFFPAVGASWNLHNENFFNKNGFLNALKLRASYGLTGEAPPVYYDYIHHYVGASDYYFGSGPAIAYGIAEELPKDITTCEKGFKLNVGADLAFAENRGIFTVDYYRNDLQDLAQYSSLVSGVSGWGASVYQNLGNSLYSGVEITAGWADKLGSFGYYVSGNLAFSDSKVLYNDEPLYPYSWMQRTGGQAGALFGYVSDGFITQAGEGPVVEGYTSVPGDIKYKDLNDDGIINDFDKRSIGTQKPLMFYGADFGFSWKNLSLSFLIQGVSNRDILLTGASEWEFQNDGKGQAYQHHLNRWTPETAETASYPRLSVGNNVNNHAASDFWLRKGDYLRLKNAEVSYSFDKISLGKMKIKGLRVFVNGLNLLTVSDLKHSDPEVSSASYPLQRMVNGGLNLKF